MIISKPVTPEQLKAQQVDTLLKAADQIILSLALRLNALEDEVTDDGRNSGSSAK